MAAAAAAAAPGSQHRCVFVGNIPYDATEEQLIQICEEVGPVVSFRLVVDRETGKPKGYGFCEYKDEETALSARRNLQGYEINGRQLRVDFAENDKRADRSREQGRGGPGLTSNTDAQKALPGAPPIPVDPSLHQPVGNQLAATAASVMARTLGGAQASNFPAIQNGLQHPSGLGNDLLTQYLAKMSRQQLNEIMSEMKALVAQNKPLAQQLFQRIPQLSKALFQAEIMLGMVPPQLMQMANTQQPSSSIPQPLLQNNMSNHNPLLPSQQREALVGPLTGPPNSMIPRHSTVPLQHVTPQPQFPPPPIPQGSIHGNPVVPIHPRPFGSFPNQLQLPPLPASQGLMSQVRPPLPPQHPIPGQHSQPPPPDNIQQSYLSHLPASQNGSSNHPVLPNGEQTGRTADMLEIKNHPSKRPKLEDGGGAIGSGPALSIGPGSGPGSQMANADAEKQVPQLPPELESALLQQVMNLTPEQISKLPPEQQQEVIQLQQMLANQNL